MDKERNKQLHSLFLTGNITRTSNLVVATRPTSKWTTTSPSTCTRHENYKLSSLKLLPSFYYSKSRIAHCWNISIAYISYFFNHPYPYSNSDHKIEDEMMQEKLVSKSMSLVWMTNSLPWMKSNTALVKVSL